MPDDFWKRRYPDWPRNPTGYVFLARAVEEIGRAMCGSDWTGQETTATKLNPLPLDKENADLPQRRWARELINGQGRIRVFTGEQWATARKLSFVEIERTRRAISKAQYRFRAVQWQIAKRCESGELLTAIRSLEGGAMTPVPAYWWNTENWECRFSRCQLDPQRPFANIETGEGHCWIFLEIENLDRLLVARPFAAASAPASFADVHLSPYLELMLTAIRRLQITPGHQPKKAEVLAMLREVSTGNPPLSNNLLNTMATLVREPESQLGRASKNRTNRTARQSKR